MTIAAIRYNNPGNVSLPIQGWKGGGTIVGLSGQSGYASFPDMQTGYAALQQRVSTYIGRGLTTIDKLNSVYATDSNWKNGVAAASGIGKNEPLDPTNQAQMSALLNGIIKQETGKSPSALGIDTSSGLAWDPASIPSYTPTANARDVPTAINQQTVQQAASTAQEATAITEAASTQATTQAAVTQASLTSTTGWIGQIEGWLGDKFVRAFIVPLGLILLVAGLFMIAAPHFGDTGKQAADVVSKTVE